MFALELECTAENRDLMVADLYERGCAGIVELDDTHLRAFFEEPVPGSREVEDRDWVAMARERLEPMLVGARFFLVPEWRDDPSPPGRFRISVNPGMAFGTGAHESTQLCLEALEREVQPGMTVLDLGCGSGILGIAARLLGATVYGCDVDPDAVAIARQSLPLVFVGSADAVAPGRFDIVAANISPEALAALWSDIRRCLRPGGVAILSGFERQDADAQYRNNWGAVTIRIPSPPARS